MCSVAGRTSVFDTVANTTTTVILSELQVGTLSYHSRIILFTNIYPTFHRRSKQNSNRCSEIVGSRLLHYTSRNWNRNEENFEKRLQAYFFLKWCSILQPPRFHTSNMMSKTFLQNRSVDLKPHSHPQTIYTVADIIYVAERENLAALESPTSILSGSIFRDGTAVAPGFYLHTYNDRSFSKRRQSTTLQ